MAEEHKHEESIMEKIPEKIHGHDASSSSDSDDDIRNHRLLPLSRRRSTASSEEKSLFTRSSVAESLLYIFLWRNKKVSGGVLGAATLSWILFELLQNNLLTLVGHFSILALAVLFLWSSATTFIHKTPPHIPEVHIPEEVVLQLASGLRIEINRGFTFLGNIALGRDLKKFLMVIAGLWVLSKVGSSCSFLTLVYIATLLLFTVPVLYEKYEAKLDDFGEKAMNEIKKQYAVLAEKVLSKVMSKIPKGAFNKKKDLRECVSSLIISKQAENPTTTT